MSHDATDGFSTPKKDSIQGILKNASDMADAKAASSGKRRKTTQVLKHIFASQSPVNKKWGKSKIDPKAANAGWAVAYTETTSPIPSQTSTPATARNTPSKVRFTSETPERPKRDYLSDMYSAETEGVVCVVREIPTKERFNEIARPCLNLSVGTNVLVLGFCESANCEGTVNVVVNGEQGIFPGEALQAIREHCEDKTYFWLPPMFQRVFTDIAEEHTEVRLSSAPEELGRDQTGDGQAVDQIDTSTSDSWGTYTSPTNDQSNHENDNHTAAGWGSFREDSSASIEMESRVGASGYVDNFDGFSPEPSVDIPTIKEVNDQTADNNGSTLRRRNSGTFGFSDGEFSQRQVGRRESAASVYGFTSGVDIDSLSINAGSDTDIDVSFGEDISDVEDPLSRGNTVIEEDIQYGAWSRELEQTRSVPDDASRALDDASARPTMHRKSSIASLGEWQDEDAEC